MQGLEDGVRAACSGVKMVLRWRCGGVEAVCLRVGAVQGRREHAVKAACSGVGAALRRHCGSVGAAVRRRGGGVSAAITISTLDAATPGWTPRSRGPMYRVLYP